MHVAGADVPLAPIPKILSPTGGESPPPKSASAQWRRRAPMQARAMQTKRGPRGPQCRSSARDEARAALTA